MAKDDLLRRIERQVLEEGQRWMQERYKQLLEELAEEEGEVSPPEPTKPGSKEDEPTDDQQPRRRRGG